MNTTRTKVVSTTRLHIPLDNAPALVSVLLNYASVDTLAAVLDLLNDALVDLADHDVDGVA